MKLVQFILIAFAYSSQTAYATSSCSYQDILDETHSLYCYGSKSYCCKRNDYFKYCCTESEYNDDVNPTGFTFGWSILVFVGVFFLILGMLYYCCPKKPEAVAQPVLQMPASPINAQDMNLRYGSPDLVRGINMDTDLPPEFDAPPPYSSVCKA